MDTATNLITAFGSGASSRLPRWANAILVVGIGLALALFTLKALPAFEPSAQPLQPTEDHSTSTYVEAAKPDLRQLAIGVASRHLFGDSSKAVVAAVVDKPPVSAPKTRLNIKVTGVFAYTPAERAIAILAVNNGDQRAFRVGGRVIGETTLEAVYPDRVLINNRGKIEEVPLDPTTR